MKRLHILFLLLTFALVAFGQEAASRYASHSVLSSGKWVKIRVSKAGVYQLTNSSLRSMGFSNPERVRLYGLGLEVLPETAIEKIDDDLVEIPLYRTGEKALFYGRGQTDWTLRSASESSAIFMHSNNPYSNYTYYFLTESADSVPMEFAKYSYDVAADASRLDYFPDYSLVETDAFSFLNSGRTFFEAYDFATGDTRDYTLKLPGMRSGTSVRLNIQFCAAGSSTSTVDIACNDSALATLSFLKLGSYEYGRLNSKSLLVAEGMGESNTIRLKHNRVSGVTGHLDFIRASYIRNLQLSGNELLFRPAGSGDVVFRVSGASAGTVVWRVSNARSVEEVAGTFDSATGVYSCPFTSESSSALTWKEEELVALNPSASFPSPAVVGAIENQDLHALAGYDLVIVVPPSGKLTQQAQRLADLHTEVDGMSCLVVSADKIYNEFSSGTPDATAIRRFMKMLWDKGTAEAGRPRNLLLFGAGYWDNRMVTSALSSLNPDDYLLCYESENSLSHTNSYVLEEYYALLDDNGASNVLQEKPRIGVGRISATSASQAKGVVDKLETYIRNEEVGSWKNTICYLADDGNDNIHMQDAEAGIASTSALFPNYHFKRIYWDTYERTEGSTGMSYPGVEADINKQMVDGALVMNYTGHGAPYVMSHERVLKTSDFANWSSPRLPLWITAACDVAPFDMNEENIAETALLNEKGAAMGIISTARTVYSGPNRTLNVAYMKHVLGTDAQGRRITIGEALSLAKCDLIDASSSSINKAHFVLLGDPAIALQTPRYTVQIDRLNGTSAASGTTEQVSAGSILKVEGHIVDEDGQLAENYNGKIYPTIFDNEEKVTCLNNSLGESNGNTETEPYEFYDRVRTLYQCLDTIQGGKFTFSFPIPLDNNYSGQNGLISLYAANNEKTIEANGRYEEFTIDGTSADIDADTQGPDITLYLNTSSFKPGDTVNETPCLYATIHDQNGINLTGSGVGHDITLVIDNQEALTYSLNSYFQPTMGNYQSGTIEYIIPELDDGLHTLTLRAFDALNNPTSITVEFYVNVGQKPAIDEFTAVYENGTETFTIQHNRPGTTLDVTLNVYDVAGRHLWNHAETTETTSTAWTYTWALDETNSHLPSGIYIVKAEISTAGGEPATKTRKFLVLGRR